MTGFPPSHTRHAGHRLFKVMTVTAILVALTATLAAADNVDCNQRLQWEWLSADMFRPSANCAAADAIVASCNADYAACTANLTSCDELSTCMGRKYSCLALPRDAPTSAACTSWYSQLTSAIANVSAVNNDTYVNSSLMIGCEAASCMDTQSYDARSFLGSFTCSINAQKACGASPATAEPFTVTFAGNWTAALSTNTSDVIEKARDAVAELAGLPKWSVRVTSVRSGSLIVDFVVLDSAVSSAAVTSAIQESDKTTTAAAALAVLISAEALSVASVNGTEAPATTAPATPVPTTAVPTTAAPVVTTAAPAVVTTAQPATLPPPTTTQDPMSCGVLLESQSALAALYRADAACINATGKVRACNTAYGSCMAAAGTCAAAAACARQQVACLNTIPSTTVAACTTFVSALSSSISALGNESTYTGSVLQKACATAMCTWASTAKNGTEACVVDAVANCGNAPSTPSQLTLTFPGNWSSALSNSSLSNPETAAAVENSVAVGLATLLGVPQYSIQILSLSLGSLVVEFVVLEETLTGKEAAEKLATAATDAPAVQTAFAALKQQTNVDVAIEDVAVVAEAKLPSAVSSATPAPVATPSGTPTPPATTPSPSVDLSDDTSGSASLSASIICAALLVIVGLVL